MAGSFAQVPGIGVDITAENVAKVYGKYNGGGLHVVYDTDGRILEDYFGVPKEAVLGIAFPSGPRTPTATATRTPSPRPRR